MHYVYIVVSLCIRQYHCYKLCVFIIFRSCKKSTQDENKQAKEKKERTGRDVPDFLSIDTVDNQGRQESDD